MIANFNILSRGEYGYSYINYKSNKIKQLKWLEVVSKEFFEIGYRRWIF